MNCVIFLYVQICMWNNQEMIMKLKLKQMFDFMQLFHLSVLFTLLLGN